MAKQSLDDLSDKDIRKALYLSQGMIIAASIVTAVLFPGIVPSLFEWKWVNLFLILFSAGTGLAIALFELLIDPFFPESWKDDGGINRRTFRALSYPQVVLAMAIVAFSEELFFRGLLQPLVGYPAASLIFALIHTRYLKKPLLFVSAVLLSFYLGWLYLVFQSLAAPVLAHYSIDLCLGLVLKYRSFRTNV